jgi:hypothetical protein
VALTAIGCATAPAGAVYGPGLTTGRPVVGSVPIAPPQGTSKNCRIGVTGACTGPAGRREFAVGSAVA